MSFLSRLFGLPVSPEPVAVAPIEDSVFGHLEWQANLQCWNGRLPFALGGVFELAVESPDSQPLPPSEQQKQNFLKVEGRLVEIRNEAVSEFLPDFNSEGIEGDPYTAEELASALVPGDICISPEGVIVIAFYDTPENELLGGQALRIHVENDGTHSIELEG